ncbi:isoflavone reductase [Fusarium proliferatum]|nr:isoflavone reductase [Fusarium proliferatum]
MKVAILGATGATGSSIINALLESGNFTITALVRPQSVDRPSTKELEAKGVNIVPFDVNDPAEKSAEKLKGQDIAIAAISISATRDQIPFATAAKLAAVKRFIPTSFGPVVPPKGMVDLRDHKISEEELKAKLAKLGTNVLHPTDERFFDKIVTQFWYSWGVRGDNTVDYAQYLGYRLGNELYPDVKLTSFSDYIQQLLSSS